MVSEEEPFLLSQLQLAGCLMLMMENLVFLKAVFSLLVLAFHCREELSASVGLLLHQLQNGTGHSTHGKKKDVVHNLTSPCCTAYRRLASLAL